MINHLALVLIALSLAISSSRAEQDAAAPSVPGSAMTLHSNRSIPSCLQQHGHLEVIPKRHRWVGLDHPARCLIHPQVRIR